MTKAVIGALGVHRINGPAGHGWAVLREKRLTQVAFFPDSIPDAEALARKLAEPEGLVCARCELRGTRFDLPGYPVCDWCAYLDGDSDDGPERREAQVFRAAPDLLAACEAALRSLRPCGSDYSATGGYCPPGACCAHCIARAAIAKARGGEVRA